MVTGNRALHMSALLACGSVLATTLIIPSVRPFMARVGAGSEAPAHAFVSVSLLGAALAAPVAGWLARRVTNMTTLAIALALIDAALLCATAVSHDLHRILALRLAHGAVNLALVSLLIGAARVAPDAAAGSSYGFLGAAMMVGVALGSPLGTLLLRFGPESGLLGAGALELLVALGARYALLQPIEANRAPTESISRLPLGWVFVERMAIGLFVVTFAFHGRHCLGLSDQDVGWCFTAFMLPFVAAIHPAGRLCDRASAAIVASGALVFYGAGWWMLSVVDGPRLSLVLVLLGISSAAVFAGALRQAGGTRSVAARIEAMSALNSAGSLGMLVGTATAGILSAALRGRGAEPHAAHAVILSLAGVAQMVAAAFSLGWLWIRGRNVRFVRS